MNQTELREKQLENARASMIEWLSDEYELGKAPDAIEYAQEFEYLGSHYFIMKYKKDAQGDWLFGVCGGYEEGETEHCGHIFSEMEQYDPSTAEQKSIEMVKMIREYWMQRAKEEAEGSECHCDYEEDEDEEDEDSESELFSGFILLDTDHWDIEKLKQDLKNDWGIMANGWAKETNHEVMSNEEETVVFEVDGMMVACSFLPTPIPDSEAEQSAANNYMWPEAVATVKKHQAHMIVAVFDKTQSALTRGQLLVKVCCACLKQENALAIYTAATVFQPKFYLEAAEMMKEGGLPVLNWIHFGLYQANHRVNSYTLGLEQFGKSELEIINSTADPEELRDFLFRLVYYILDEDITLQDGESIGFSAEQRLKINLSAGVAVTGNSFKIAYE